jgi:hypothetical protein
MPGVQEQLGQADTRRMQIYTHVLQRGSRGGKDRLSAVIGLTTCQVNDQSFAV